MQVERWRSEEQLREKWERMILYVTGQSFWERRIEIERGRGVDRDLREWRVVFIVRAQQDSK